VSAEKYYKAGINFFNEGNNDSALSSFYKVLEYVPDHPDTHNLIGLIYLEKKEIANALNFFQKAITLYPLKPEFYVNLGLALQENGQVDTAIINFQKAISLDPENAQLYNGTGVSLQSTGRADEAISNFQKAITLNNSNPEFYYNLGISYQYKKEFPEAVENYLQAIRLNPNNPKYYNRLGDIYVETENYAKALPFYQQAIRLKQENPYYYNNYGIALQNANYFEQAVANFQLALDLKPGFSLFYNNIATAYEDWGKAEQAISYFQKAITADPANIRFQINLAGAYVEAGNYQAALDKYLYALNLEPENPDLNYNLSLLYLLQEDFSNGWRKYGCFGFKKERSRQVTENLKRPEWEGEPLAGKRIYVYSEQGFGDTIQFFRYLPQLKAKGAEVIFGCYPALKNLIENCQGFDRLIDKPINETGLDYDLHISVAGLPSVLKITSEGITVPVPYLKVAGDLEKYWQEQLSRFSGFKAGFVWEPDPSSKTWNKRRLPLQYFYELSRLTGITLFSLQKGQAVQQLQETENIINMADNIRDFADTAAIINNLDLVITIDTSIAHLAGALGKPVWTLLPFSPDWRWFLNRTDSPWYPSMKLFRQERAGDWDSVVSEIKTELGRLL
jgi:tetratricopeptide (TPR) repeat protein